MTRKHFNAIAKALAFTRPTAAGRQKVSKRSKQWQQWARDVKALADICDASNDSFDRGQFYHACGLEDE